MTPGLAASDWRDWPAPGIAALFEAERDVWARRFHWEQRWTFGELDAARRRGALPGRIVAGADGVVRAWTFFLRYGRLLQIGYLVSDAAEATAAVLAAAMAAPEARGAEGVVAFSPDAPGLATALSAAGLRVEPYDYLVREARATDPSLAHATPGLRGMSPADEPEIAALFGAAYAGAAFDRPFVPGGEPDEWRRYVAQLIDTRGCGEWCPSASAIVAGVAGSADPSAALIATRLAADTGHIAQVAVAPHARGQGLAHVLLHHALAALAVAGCRRTTLLVARHNTAARRLYDKLGFVPSGTFISGTRS